MYKAPEECWRIYSGSRPPILSMPQFFTTLSKTYKVEYVSVHLLKANHQQIINKSSTNS